jgi:2-polyprenyl-3-methyl-5-hydroxy-6-metoxy-1,4-benzoquinol methylase
MTWKLCEVLIRSVPAITAILTFLVGFLDAQKGKDFKARTVTSQYEHRDRASLPYNCTMMSKLHQSLPLPVKKVVWELKYGILGYPRYAAASDALEFLTKNLSNRASLLELGAGRGSLLHGLREKGWTGPYCGVDISKKAITDARKRGDQRASWIVSDIERFSSPLKWDAIALIESVYYVKFDVLSTVLTRLMDRLEDHGFMLLRIHDPRKFEGHVQSIQSWYPQMEKVGDVLWSISKQPAAAMLDGQPLRSKARVAGK